MPIRRPDALAALDLAELKPDQVFLDLGSGDGRLLLEAARRGATAIGYEINPLLYLWSLAVTWPERRRVKIHFGDYWRSPLPEADVIYIFLINRYTQKLDHKLSTELKKPTKVVSYVFDLPREPVKRTSNTMLYQYP